ncbi:succinate dehydrogenase cytochrome b556 subunit [Caldovatus sediminis]|uniref:Succinate dehydrogenase cytochrome b556 subunit n=1 Tax=Caldovatus sediminis TaxID=2041189 RepID=A0A8J3EAN0_9PROT|nr:succinate dehydrogenase, cytochrome b556 subunit [Caldovatus sediminis]GGG17992.1 succinate dehydrogenase cytochrome b556 subunit [Caldovatus sediminis]
MSIMKDSREATMVGHRSDGATVRRPLSPHLQVYDMLQMSSALSISHRITGVIWAIGLVFLVWWLVAAAAGPAAFAAAQWFFSSFLGVVLLLGLTAAAWYHTLNGVRHLAWDVGWGYDIPTMYRTGWAVLIGTAALTVLTWIVLLVAFF